MKSALALLRKIQNPDQMLQSFRIGFCGSSFVISILIFFAGAIPALAVPDLIVTSAISVNPNPVTTGNNLTVTYTVKNNGNTSAIISHTRIQVKTNTSGVTLTQVTNNTPALNAGSSTTDVVTVPIPNSTSPGIYTVHVILDVDTLIGQSAAGQTNDIYRTAFGALTIQSPVLLPDILVAGAVVVSCPETTPETIKKKMTKTDFLNLETI